MKGIRTQVYRTRRIRGIDPKAADCITYGHL